MPYKVDYSADGPEQIVQDGASASAPTIRYVEVPRQGFAFPSIVKTAAVFVAGAAALFAWEVCAPEGYRASTIVGIYDARIAAAVRAAELQQQSHYETWAAGVKLSAEQQAEQYKAVTQGVLQNYSATYDRGKIITQAAMDLQGRYTATVMGQKVQEQGVDIGIINLMRGLGRIANGLEKGAGDSALGYADDLSNTLQGEITDAARQGAGTSVVTWDTGLASPSEVAATLNSIKPLDIPPPPSIGEARPTIAEPLH